MLAPLNKNILVKFEKLTKVGNILVPENYNPNSASGKAAKAIVVDGKAAGLNPGEAVWFEFHNAVELKDGIFAVEAEQLLASGE